MDKKRVVGYIRVSTKGQAVEGYSLENQKKDIIDRCKKEGYELVDIYEDAGISGASMEGRDGFKNLLKDVKSGKFDCVMIWKLSRLSRSTHDAVNIIKFLDENKVALISISENMDTIGSFGKTFMMIASMFGELERDNIIVQVKGGMIEKARQGEWNGGIPPLGYDLVDKKLVVNKKNAEVVKRIYGEYLKGKGYKAIAKELNDEGYKTSKEKSFSGSGIKAILTNIIYSGKISWGKLRSYGKKDSNGRRHREYNSKENVVLADGQHEAIIDEETYKKVQDKIKSNPRHNLKQFNGHHILSGLLRCPQCGSSMSIQYVKSKGREYWYYTCNKYVNKKECKPNSISKKAIEEFFDIFEKLINEDKFKHEIADSYGNVNGQIKELNQCIKREEKYIRDLDETSNQMFAELVKGTSAYKDMVRKNIEKNIDKIEAHKERIKNAVDKIDKIGKKEINDKELYEILEYAGKVMKLMDKEAQQRLIRMLISSIETDNKHIKAINLSFDKRFMIESDTENRTISESPNFIFGISNLLSERM